MLTGDREIKKLNRIYRGKDKATDVLSFPSGFDPFEHAVPGSCLGDLVISIETARRQAAQYDVSLRDELKRLIVHGYLHLLGYDHEKVPPAEAARMRRTESRLLARI